MTAIRRVCPIVTLIVNGAQVDHDIGQVLFGLEHRTWDPELCALFEVPLHALPGVRDSSARFGETTLDGTLDQPLPICGVMGDSQASLFAQRCFEPGAAKVTSLGGVQHVA